MRCLLLFQAGHIGLSPPVVITISRRIQRRFVYRLVWEKYRESYPININSQNQAFMAYIMHQKCKVQVIGWHVHKIMMIPITRNHQEGEEHARRSSVSSSVSWSIEGIVLKKYQVCVCSSELITHLLCNSMWVMLWCSQNDNHRAMMVNRVYPLREKKEELSVQEGAEERKKAH